MRPSASRPAYFVRKRGSSQPPCSASATAKPTLWRVPSYSCPGLPRPTTSQSTGAEKAAHGAPAGLFALGLAGGRLGAFAFGRGLALGGSLALDLLALLADELGLGPRSPPRLDRGAAVASVAMTVSSRSSSSVTPAGGVSASSVTVSLRSMPETSRRIFFSLLHPRYSAIFFAPSFFFAPSREI